MGGPTASWQDKAKAKRESILALIPPKWRLNVPLPSAHEQLDVTGKYIQQFLSAREIEITETDATGIVGQTCIGKWKAREVTEAFCHRAAIAHQLTNCLHEIFFEDAIKDAERLDHYYATHDRACGPLHGLPISLKDQFHVKNVETTMGYVGWIDTFQGQKGTGKERVFESELVLELRNLGAVLYCKTSVPQTLMTGETVNNIIGYTWNPKNRNLTCGGSSGGEGALISLKGSPVGFGTDIGGSVRIPAAFNGLYGLRPSAGRLPYEGMANSMDGQNSLLSVVGPISHSAASLRLMMKSVLSQQPWNHDPMVLNIPWREDEETEVLEMMRSRGGQGPRLSFGIFPHDQVVRPQPPVRRALETVAKVLQELGHYVVEWQPPSHQKGNEIGTSTWTFDGGKDVHKAYALSGEPVVPQIASVYGHEPREEASASQIAATNVAMREWRKEYMEYWNSTKDFSGTGRPVDAFIAPVAPFPASRPERYRAYGYSVFVNVLDYSACTIPVLEVDKAIDVVDQDFRPFTKSDQAVHDDYDPEIYHGASVGVQVIGRRLQEERVLALAELIGEAIARHNKT